MEKPEPDSMVPSELGKSARKPVLNYTASAKLNREGKAKLLSIPNRVKSAMISAQLVTREQSERRLTSVDLQRSTTVQNQQELSISKLRFILLDRALDYNTLINIRKRLTSPSKDDQRLS